jgi:hypothetical protein
MTEVAFASPSDTCRVAPRLLAMRVELLVSFAVLAEELHFTRAAQVLYISQSGLSRRISALERCLGVALLDRTTRSPTLTSAGRELLPHALAVLASLRSATDALERATSLPAQRRPDGWQPGAPGRTGHAAPEPAGVA